MTQMFQVLSLKIFHRQISFIEEDWLMMEFKMKNFLFKERICLMTNRMGREQLIIEYNLNLKCEYLNIIINRALIK